MEAQDISAVAVVLVDLEQMLDHLQFHLIVELIIQSQLVQEQLEVSLELKEAIRLFLELHFQL